MKTPLHLPPPVPGAMPAMPVFIPRGAGPRLSKREQNAQRQREFRERNPGYYGRLHAKRRAGVKALGERLREAERLAALESVQETVQESVQASVQASAIQTVTLVERAPAPVNISLPESARSQPREPQNESQGSTELLALFWLMAIAASRIRTRRSDFVD